MCDTAEGLVATLPEDAVAVETAEIETVAARRVAVNLSVGIDAQLDAKALSDALAIVFWDEDQDGYLASHPRVQNLRVAGWKLFQFTRPNGEVVRHENGATAFVLDIETECVSDLPEESLRNMFGVNFVTPEGALLGERHSEGNEIVDYIETHIHDIEG
jgi:hypothetical protein